MKQFLETHLLRKLFVTGLVALLAATSLQAQSRKYISQFSHFQSYFNPGLTGYEGSTLRGFVRNQWAGLEGAPKTYFLSAELDLGELAGLEDPARMGQNSLSLNMLHDTYGAFKETELMLGYASRVRLSENHQLRLGAGLNYQQIGLDGNALSVEEQNDPTLGNYLGSFSTMQVLDFNLGLALTHPNYYLSYGMHRVNGGKISSGDDFMEGYPASKMLQAGFRERMTPSLAIITNAFYRTQKGLPDQIDINLKALLMDRIWIGGGHRFNYASNLQFGVLTDRMRLGYVYEFPLTQSYQLPGRIHEFTAIFNLFPKNQNEKGNALPIW